VSRYAAFISYSHADHAVARWLHRGLETYRLPKVLVGTESPFGAVPRQLPSVFRDRDELPASGDLGAELRAALANSRFQIVICSPHAAASKWVNEEILDFKRVHGEYRTLALIAEGEPYAGDARECFPPALRLRLADDGSLSGNPAEPIAADIRPGKDGRRLALLKLIAGITGIRLDALARRDAARRQRRLAMLAAVSTSIAVLTIGLAIYAESQRRVAERQRRLADKSLDFLIGTFAIANPATENPRTITALTILDRASKRAMGELKDEPAVSARLLEATGRIYFNLGLPKESERDLRVALAREPAWSEGRASTLLSLAALAYKRGNAKESNQLIDEASASYSQRAEYARALDAQVAERRGLAAIVEGKYVFAADQLDNAAALYGKASGDNREDMARSWMSEGIALTLAHHISEADRVTAKGAALYLEKFGPNHVQTALAIQNVATSDFESGRLPLAERRIGQALAILDRVLEGDHPRIAAALILQGRVRTVLGDEAGALAALDRARGIFVRLYGPRNAAVGDVDFYAAEAEAKRGDITAALTRLARTKTIYDAAYGPDDPDQVELLVQRARLLAGAGQMREGAHECDAARALQKRIDAGASALAEVEKSCAAIH
jgi:hypothetical protein